MAIGVVVALALTGVVALARRVGDDRTDAGSGPMWQRVSVTKAFGPGVDALGVAASRTGFVALTRRRQTDIAAESTRVWRSDDGRSWTRARLPGPTNGYAYLAASDDRVVILVQDDRNRRVLTYASRDGEVWRRGDDLPQGSDPTTVVSDGVVFAAQQPTGLVAGPVRVSSDGLHWRRAGVYQPLARLGALAVTIGRSPDGSDVAATSRDLRAWAVTARLPPLTGRPLVADRFRRRLLTIQYEPSRDVAGGRLLTSADAHRFDEITSFHARFPIGNPDHIVQSGSWWVLGGNRNAGQVRRTTMWSTPDLEHWIEMPAGLRGTPNGGHSVLLAAHDDVVVGLDGSNNDPSDIPTLWIWRRPAKVPRLVRVSGRWTGSGGPAGWVRHPLTGRVAVLTPAGRLVDASFSDTDGRYALDLPPGKYVLDGPCDRTTVVVTRRAVHRDVECQMR